MIGLLRVTGESFALLLLVAIATVLLVAVGR